MKRIACIALVAVSMYAGAAWGQVASLVQAAAEPAATLTAAAAYDGQTKDDLLEGLDRLGANAKEKNEVNLDKNMLGLVRSKKGGRYADLADKMDFITVRNYEYASKDQYRRSDLDALRQRLNGDGWSHVVRNEEGNETNDIVLKADSEGFVREMVIVNAEPKELSIVHIRGRFRMEDLQGAMGSVMGAMGSAMGSVGGAIGRASVAAHPVPPAPPAPPASQSSPTVKQR